MSDLAGTWKGDVMALGADPTGMPDPTKDTVWQARVIIRDCSPGTVCGSFSYATTDFKGSGKSATCEGTLKYRGFYKDRAAFEFEETISASAGATICQPMLAVLTPFASGANLGIEEKKMSWYTHGLLVKSAS